MLPCLIVSKWSQRSYLQLSHLMELQAEVRHILPELQQVDFERDCANV